MAEDMRATPTGRPGPDMVLAPAPAQTERAERLRRARVGSILKEDVIQSMAVGFLPWPLFDAAVLMALQVGMVRRLCEVHGVSFDRYRAETVLSAAVGAMPVISVVGVSSLVKSVPGFGTVAGGALTAALSGAVTFAQGRVLAAHLARGESLEDMSRAALRRARIRRRRMRVPDADRIRSRPLRPDRDRGRLVPAPAPAVVVP